MRERKEHHDMIGQTKAAEEPESPKRVAEEIFKNYDSRSR